LRHHQVRWSEPILAVLAATIRAERILEVGCGLGYSALCLAHGSGALVETIDRDPEHVRLAPDRKTNRSKMA